MEAGKRAAQRVDHVPIDAGGGVNVFLFSCFTVWQPFYRLIVRKMKCDQSHLKKPHYSCKIEQKRYIVEIL